MVRTSSPITKLLTMPFKRQQILLWWPCRLCILNSLLIWPQ